MLKNNIPEVKLLKNILTIVKMFFRSDLKAVLGFLRVSIILPIFSD